LRVYGRIYGLYDPITDELRYIGQTIMSLKRRLQHHLTPQNLGKQRHSSCWLRHLRGRGLKPTIRPLALGFSKEELDQLEVQHISKAKKAGARLTNHTDGGRGQKGLAGLKHPQYRNDIPTDFILQRLAKGRTKVQVAEELGVSATFIHRRLNQVGLTGENRPKSKVTAWNKGRPHSPEHVQNFSASRKGKAAGASHHAYRHDIRDEDLLQKSQEGLSPSQIAEGYGVARITIVRRLGKTALSVTS
jgi:DNA invertase Pin-like site-specific DNA recombinase